jgi:hemoglobin-like flavoprotein
MSPEEVETFQTSLKRCLVRPGFLDSFYKSFMSSSDEVAEKFKNTDFKRQNTALADSLYVVANAAVSDEGSLGREGLARVAARHNHKDRDIRPELYDLWRDSLLATVRIYDPEFTPAIEEAWRSILGWGIEYMRSRY